MGQTLKGSKVKLHYMYKKTSSETEDICEKLEWQFGCIWKITNGNEDVKSL